MEEEWKFYKETNNFRWGKMVYEVSSFGRIKRNGIIEKPQLTKNGYLKLGKIYIHRAIAEAFIPNPENKPCIDHINTIRTDNRVENIRWVTYSENINNPITKERQRIAASKKRGYKPMLGKHHSEETKKKCASVKGKHRVYDNISHTKWHYEY